MKQYISIVTMPHMFKEGMGRVACERCGGDHSTERHPKPKIDVNITDALWPPGNEYRGRFWLKEELGTGWETMGPLMKRLGRARESLDILMAPQRLAHPEWFAVFRAQNGTIAEAYHHELVKFVERRLTEPPPEKWQPGTSYGPTVNEVAKLVARSNPELTRQFVAPDGPSHDQLIIYHSPEFIGAMREWVEEQRRKTFPAETTGQQLSTAFGLDERFSPQTPYASPAALDAARNKIIERFESDLVEDPARVSRARAKTRRIVDDLRRSRGEDW